MATRPVQFQILPSWPATEDPNTDCAICLSHLSRPPETTPLSLDGRVVVHPIPHTPNGHPIHFACLQNWVRSSHQGNACTLCRTQINPPILGALRQPPIPQSEELLHHFQNQYQDYWRRGISEIEIERLCNNPALLDHDYVRAFSYATQRPLNPFCLSEFVTPNQIPRLNRLSRPDFLDFFRSAYQLALSNPTPLRALKTKIWEEPLSQEEMAYVFRGHTAPFSVRRSLIQIQYHLYNLFARLYKIFLFNRKS